jgi:hypothetical protein
MRILSGMEARVGGLVHGVNCGGPSEERCVKKVKSVKTFKTREQFKQVGR